MRFHPRHLLAVALMLLIAAGNRLLAADILIAEGEQFKPLDQKGWKVIHQNDSYGSHTYGGAWSTHGGLLGAPAASVDSVATQMLTVATAGHYRVWSKYQAPPYFHYLHKIELLQGGKVEQSAVASDPQVEAVVMDHPKGTLVTVLNWSSAPINGLKLQVRVPAAPSSVRSVRQQKTIPVAFASGVATLAMDLNESDYLLLMK